MSPLLIVTHEKWFQMFKNNQVLKVLKGKSADRILRERSDEEMKFAVNKRRSSCHLMCFYSEFQLWYQNNIHVTCFTLTEEVEALRDESNLNIRIRIVNLKKSTAVLIIDSFVVYQANMLNIIKRCRNDVFVGQTQTLASTLFRDQIICTTWTWSSGEKAAKPATRQRIHEFVSLPSDLKEKFVLYDPTTVNLWRRLWHFENLSHIKTKTNQINMIIMMWWPWWLEIFVSLLLSF